MQNLCPTSSPEGLNLTGEQMARYSVGSVESRIECADRLGALEQETILYHRSSKKWLFPGWKRGNSYGSLRCQ